MKIENKTIGDYIVDGKIEIEKIVKDYSNYVYSIIKNVGYNLNMEDIEEIISDVFVAIWNNQYKLKMDKMILPYIAGITKNLIRKKYRECKLSNISDYDEELIISDKLEVIVEKNEINSLILNELNKMSIEDQRIFMYFYFEQRHIKEIANILGVTESKVKMRLHRMKKKLKRKISEEEV